MTEKIPPAKPVLVIKYTGAISGEAYERILNSVREYLKDYYVLLLEQNDQINWETFMYNEKFEPIPFHVLQEIKLKFKISFET